MGKFAESFKNWRMGVVTVALFGVVVCGSAQAEELPEADVVIQKYVEALGGEEKLTASKSRVTKGVFALPDFGMTGDITTWVAPPNMYSEITLDTFGSIQRGIKDGLAWELNPMQGATIHEGAQQKNMEREAAFDSYVNWKEYYTSAETVDTAEVDGNACYVVEFRPAEGSPSKQFFDKESGLLRKITGEDPNGMEVGMLFEDYKEIDGVKVPHKMTSIGGQAAFAITIESVEFDAEIPSDRFDPPAEIGALKEKAQ